SGAFGDPNVIELSADNSYVIGNNNTVTAGNDKVFILGNNVKTTAANSVFLGDSAKYIADGTSSKGLSTYSTNADIKDIYGNMALGSGNLAFAGATPTGVVSVGDVNNKERRIQNVAAGLIDASSTDAINGSQLYAVVQNLKTNIATDNRNVGVATLGGTQTIVSPYIDVDNESDISNKTKLLESYIESKIAADTTWATLNDTQRKNKINQWTNDFITTNTDGKQFAQATGTNAIAIGNSAQAKGDGSVALGKGSVVNTGATNAFATTGGTVAANATNAIALGGTANYANSVAIGSGSVANTAASVTGYDPLGATHATTDKAWTSTRAAVAVGNTASDVTRQITGVAAGYEDTDAVNVAQLKNAVGLKFAGDDKGNDSTKTDAENHIAVVKNGGVLDIIGKTDTSAGAHTPTDYTHNNIGVSYGNDHTLKVQLAENVDLGDTGSLTMGTSGTDLTVITPNSIAFSGNNGVISNVKNHLVSAANQTSNPSTSVTASNEAATVFDVMNAGWNLQDNDGNAVDFVAHGDTVKFLDGKGSTVAAVSTDKKTSTVKYDVNIKHKDSNKYVKVGLDSTSNFYEIDDSAIDTAVTTVTTAINNAGFNLKTTESDGTVVNTGIPATGEKITNNKTVTLDAGKNIKITQTTGGNVSIATKDDVTFTSVTTTNLTATGETKLGSNFTVANDGTVTYNKTVTPTNNNEVVNVQYANTLGWNVGNNSKSKVGETITNGKQVNFVNGVGTTSQVVADGTNGANIAYNLNYDNSKGNVQVQTNSDNSVSFNAPTTTLTTTNGKVDNLSAGGDNLTTAQNVANMINQTYWTASDGTNNTSVHAGDTVTFKGKDSKVSVTNTSGVFEIGLSDDLGWKIGDASGFKGKIVNDKEVDFIGGKNTTATVSV
ncbi:MAG: hypothetical protein J6T41_05080, partial [Neisseriaceae bacterium]|nr:hypothetical protein [Neisseriaceae bacterium]